VCAYVGEYFVNHFNPPPEKAKLEILMRFQSGLNAFLFFFLFRLPFVREKYLLELNKCVGLNAKGSLLKRAVVQSNTDG
jgi:hypothetical protein